MRCFRLVDSDYAHAAFSGEGARRYGGRWNSPGVAVVYISESLSLAQLELLVHLDAADLLLSHWRYFVVEVADTAILRLDDWLGVPRDFAATPASPSTRTIGDRWVADSLSVALAVPSALTPGERNLILNPGHDDYADAIQIGAETAFMLDRRLIRS